MVSATEVISDGAEGIILESVLEGFAEYYSADLAEKVVRGMTENLLKGKFNGGTIPIGYYVDAEQHLQPDPVVAPLILEAFKMYGDGALIKDVRVWLNQKGVRNAKGGELSHNSVQYMLHNRRYIGEYSFRDRVMLDVIPPIVPTDLFDRVQERLEKNKNSPARFKAEEEYLLTTKLFCGYCGAYLCGESGRSRTGTVHHYYKCVSVKKRRTDCHKKPVRKKWIEDIVVRRTMEMLQDDSVIDAIVTLLMDMQEQESTSLPLFERQLAETNTAIGHMLDAIQQGILTKSTKERLESLERTRDELEMKISQEKMEHPKISEEFMRFWLLRFRQMDVTNPEHRRMLIDAFVNAIFLYDDKMVMTFNYKEGEETISLKEVEKSAVNAKNGSDLDCSGEHKPSLAGRFFAVFVELFTEEAYTRSCMIRE